MKSIGDFWDWWVTAFFWGIALCIAIFYCQLSLSLWIVCAAAILAGLLNCKMSMGDDNSRLFRLSMCVQFSIGLGALGFSIWHGMLWFLLDAMTFALCWVLMLFIGFWSFVSSFAEARPHHW